MITASRAAINRANAQRSTGPRTESGKKASSLNALRHGLTGQIVVMPTEDLEAYQRHLLSFSDELRPVGVIELNLVQALADCSWRLNRVAALETNLLTLGMTSATPNLDATQQIQDAMSTVGALESQSKALSNLSLHSQRLSRQFERTVNQLRELQNARQTREQAELDDLLDVMEMHTDKGVAFDPSEHGFVFLESQVTESKRRRNREHLIEEAYQHAA